MEYASAVIIGSAILFLIASIINGFWKRKATDIVNYYATPNMFSSATIIISMLGTIIGGGIVIGTTEMGAKGGVVGIILGIGYAVAFILLGRAVPRIRELTNDDNKYSLIDLLSSSINKPYRVFSKDVEISSLVSIVYFTSYFFILAAQIIAIVSLLDIINVGNESGDNILLVVSLLCTINIILYSAFGGLEKDIRTDIFQVSLIFVSMLVLLIVPFTISDNPFREILTLPQNYFNGTGYGIAFLIVVLLAPLPSFLVRYDIWQRVIAAKDTKTAQGVFKVLSIGVLLSFTVFSFLGMFIQSHFNLATSEMPKAIFQLINSSGTYVPAILLVCILTAVLSSADTFLNVASISFSKIAFKKSWAQISATNSIVHLDEAKKKLKRQTMFSTVVIGVISIIVGYSFDSIVSLLIGAVSALTVLFPVILSILLRKNVSSRAAFWSISMGYLIFLIFSFGLEMPDESFLPAFLIACLIFYSISYIERKMSEQTTP